MAMLMTASVSRAQWVVHDPANTARDAISALYQQYLVNTQWDQQLALARMAQRLSALTSLDKYRLRQVPQWGTHDAAPATLLALTRAYATALNRGQTAGSAWAGATDPITAASLRNDLTPAARRAVLARLATLDLADTTAIAATVGTGRLRNNGPQELAAINALETDVINPSQTQSTAAVLDKLSGAVLIGARQRQARVQLLTGLLEQLLIDSKRSRDSETAMLNMQIVQWRDASAANEAFVAGTGDALRSWRQR
jgi:hypothetical protein